MITDAHLEAKHLILDEKYPHALEILMDLLDENPNDETALFLFGSVAIHQDKKGLAYNIYARCAKLAPDRSEVWINYGRCQADSEEGWKASEWCFKKALEIHPESTAALGNLAALEIQRCRPEISLKYVEQCLAINPEYQVALSSKGFAYLMMGKWDEGWKYYATMLGTKARPDVRYEDLPMWDGTKGQTVIVYGEQGIGDELIYAEPIRDMAKDCTVILDCMPRLENLFKRSLPENVIVCGGRWSDELSLPAGVTPEASIPMAGVPIYYRKSRDAFPGTPYLKADDEMRVGMRALLDSLGDKPKIGIAWTGGTKRSRCQFRQSSLEDMTPIIRTDKATFISLQYNDPSEEMAEFEKKRGIKVHHFPWITEVKEYDLTAALVAELDLVISVPTSVTQLAGAMGVECWTRVPSVTGWLFTPKDYAWADAIKLYHNEKPKVIARDLKEWINAKTHKLSAVV